MPLLKKERGLTYMETMIASTIIAFVILGSINLISSVYKGITANQLKTYALNIVSEQIDLLKQNGFDGCQVTDDSCLPNPMSNLETCSATYTYDYDTYSKVTMGAQVFSIYRYIQWALEDSNGNIIPKKSGDLTASDPRTLKQITVTVNYTSNGSTKSTTVNTLISNKDVLIMGSSVEGNVTCNHPSGPDTGPGMGSNATVHFVGYPQYTTQIDSDAGHYKVPNVMPGYYTLYADGAGFTTTYLATNPLCVSPIATAIIGVNISCPAIIGCVATGVVYIQGYNPSATFTPTSTPNVAPTLTPTLACGQTKILPAIATMTGKSSNWSNCGNIKADDGAVASCSGNTQRLYTDFTQYTQANTYICAVRITVNSYVDIVSTGNNNTLLLSLTNGNGAAGTWADTLSPAGWAGTQDSTRASLIINSTATNNVETVDITGLYSTWTWANVNSLGACFNTTNNKWLFNLANCTAYMDLAQLEVDYDVMPFTYTPTKTSTITPTPNATFTATPICANGARVIASDGLSAPFDVTNCGYTLTNINPAAGTTDISAVMMVGSDTYYAISQSVAVALGTTPTVNLMLVKMNGIPSLKGIVADATNHSILLSGVDIYLGVTKVATTGGGGAYAVVPVAPGTYQIDANAPGYNIVQNYTYTFTSSSGLRTADTLYMMPCGSVSGKVTDYLTGNPMPAIQVEVQTSSGSLVASGVTDGTGVYLITGVGVGSNYTLQVDYVVGQQIPVVPSSGTLSPVVISKGVTTLNQNFKLQQNYRKISGKVSVDGVTATNGITIIAVPNSVTITPDAFRINNSIPGYQKYTGQKRISYPMYSLTLERDGTFQIKAPVNSTYNIYAYYSYVSYTGTVSNPIKQVKNYYKEISNITVGTTDVTNQNITGSLSAWTSY